MAMIVVALPFYNKTHRVTNILVLIVLGRLNLVRLIVKSMVNTTAGAGSVEISKIFTVNEQVLSPDHDTSHAEKAVSRNA